MPASVIHPTPYPDVNAVLQMLLSSVQATLGNELVGLYLYGSLASGDFDPLSSDIDFVVVTAHEIPAETIPALEAMHRCIAASGLTWAAKLEGSYIARHALRRYDPADAPRPCINEGSFYVARHEIDWIIQRHILREQGGALAGPALQPMIDPVRPDDLRRAVAGILHEWWLPQLQNPFRLHRPYYQAYAVLTMCRALHTLHYGTVVSKPAAAQWAQEALGERWAALIGQALAQRHEMPPGWLDATLDFIRYTLDRSQQAEIPADEA